MSLPRQFRHNGHAIQYNNTTEMLTGTRISAPEGSDKYRVSPLHYGYVVLTDHHHEVINAHLAFAADTMNDDWFEKAYTLPSSLVTATIFPSRAAARQARKNAKAGAKVYRVSYAITFGQVFYYNFLHRS